MTSKTATTFEERVAALRARAKGTPTINTIDLTDLYTMEVPGQDTDVILTEDAVRYLHWKCADLLGLLCAED